MDRPVVMEGLIEDIHQPGYNVEWGPSEGRLDSRTTIDLRRDFSALLGYPSRGFPGAQPVSFMRKSLDELRSQDYYVCEKSDGVRYLLWLTVDDTNSECQYLVDRKNQYWHIKRQTLHFPHPPPEEPSRFHSDTVIDGELVMDDIGGGRREPRFLVFDCLMLDGQSLMERTLDKRLAYFKEKVFRPYRDLLFKVYPEELQFQPFIIELKEMQFSYGLEMMFRQVLPNLKHGNDGLIFTCRNSRYVFGTDPHILKWKPAVENTVDFRMRLHFPKVEDEDGGGEPYVDYDSVPRAELLANRGTGKPPEHIGELHISAEEWETLKGLGDPLDDRVVECGLDEQKRWRLHRFRDDKHDANHISVVQSVLESIYDGVSEQDLLEAAKGIKDNWKARAAAAQARR